MQIKKVIKQVVKVEGEYMLDLFCKDNQISKTQLLEQNKTKKINKNDIVVLPTPYNKLYIVKPLDTIESIATTLGVCTNDVICATKGKIFVGQKIFL